MKPRCPVLGWNLNLTLKHTLPPIGPVRECIVWRSWIHQLNPGLVAFIVSQEVALRLAFRIANGGP